ncbi:hypothetical protein AALP_AA7G141500 [Arabis alpina]|uniref:Uncharacterized protein n=1 Tax=Arabis alpina TaxID=50452 RepID=A0A087GHZ1_ARAAL|nr:hypothetical protein AALP_AA7G141500 [Arabis alpina]
MEHPRSFRNLAPRTTGSDKPPTPTTTTTSAATTAADYCASEPRDTSSAKKTTTTARGSRLPSATRTELVAALPALPDPLPSYHDAKKAAKGKGHEGDDHKRSSDRDDVIDVDREPKKAWARSASPPRRVSRSVFQDKASASSLFSTLVFHNDVVSPINTESSGDMMRQGLKFLALVNKVGHKLEAEVEDLKKKLEDEMRRTENARTAADGLRVERNAADALAAAEEREQYLAAIVTKRDSELATVVETLGKGDEHIQSLERKFARAKEYAASVGVADPSGSLLGGAGSRKAAVVGVDGKFSLIGGVGAEVTESRIEDVAEDAGTVGAPEEMRTDEDSQGPRIDALTKDPRLDDVFGETEAEGAPVTQVAPPGVDEEIVP